MSERIPYQGHLTSENVLKGHSLLWNKHSDWWLFLWFAVKVSSQPASRYLHGYMAVAAILSRVKFLVLINVPLQDGHFEICNPQLPQMLCPFSHNLIGDSMYSRQTGHSSSFKKSQLSCLRSAVFFVMLFDAICYTSIRKRNRTIKFPSYNYTKHTHTHTHTPRNKPSRNP